MYYSADKSTTHKHDRQKWYVQHSLCYKFQNIPEAEFVPIAIVVITVKKTNSLQARSWLCEALIRKLSDKSSGPKILFNL